MTTMTLRHLTICVLLTFALGGVSACFIGNAQTTTSTSTPKEEILWEYRTGSELADVSRALIIDMTWKTPGRPVWRVRVYQDSKVVISGNAATAAEDLIPTLMAGTMNSRGFSTSLCVPEQTPSGGYSALLMVTSSATDAPFWKVSVGSRGSVSFEGDIDPEAETFWNDVGGAVSRICSELER